jgi:hypothetical protein
MAFSLKLRLSRLVTLKWPVWTGTFDGRITMLTKRLHSWRGRNADLHKFIAADEAGCYHTHPATAIRVVLWGGYVEEMPDGSQRIWRTGMVGIVRPGHAHRIHALRNGRVSYSLWLRGKRTHDIRLVGDGWPAQFERAEIERAVTQRAERLLRQQGLASQEAGASCAAP